MATAFTPTPVNTAVSSPQLKIFEKGTVRPSENRPAIATFVRDLIEDVIQKPLQPAALAKHDMFREHINAMAISYFALIVLLIGVSVPLIAYWLS